MLEKVSQLESKVESDMTGHLYSVMGDNSDAGSLYSRRTSSVMPGSRQGFKSKIGAIKSALKSSKR